MFDPALLPQSRCIITKRSLSPAAGVHREVPAAGILGETLMQGSGQRILLTPRSAGFFRLQGSFENGA